MFTLTVGQIVRLNLDVEIWNEDDSLAARIDAGTPLEIIAICYTPVEYYDGIYNVDVRATGPLYSGHTTNIDIEAQDLI